MSWKRFILGEKMPDKNDPNYRDRYVREVEAGKKFAKITKIDKFATYIQSFANRHTRLFLTLVFGFVFSCFCLNLYRIGRVYATHQEQKLATEMQEEKILSRHRPHSLNAKGERYLMPHSKKHYQQIKSNDNHDNGTTEEN